MNLIALLAICAAAQVAFVHGATRAHKALMTPLDLDAAQADPVGAFQSFTKSFGKKYTSAAEYQMRLQSFNQNVKYIAAHNSLDATYKLALNEFADLTFEEFKLTHLGLLPGLNSTSRIGANSPFRYESVTAAENIDWVEKGAVTPVKNQAFCGSCWAFSTTGSVEGANYLATGELISLSEQQLVDCDTSKDQGCGGGLMDYAFEYIVKNGGLDTEKDYSYWSVGGMCNKLREGRTVVSIDGYEDVPVNSEAALIKAVSSQPISVAICASEAMQFYSSGVIAGDGSCTGLNHGVLAAGYDKDEQGKPYWLVKNSWGGTWGESGYMRLERGISQKEGAFGILMAPSFPIKKSANPKHVPEVCGYFGWSECEHGSKCSCSMDFLGLFCFSWGCADKEL